MFENIIYIQIVMPNNFFGNSGYSQKIPFAADLSIESFGIQLKFNAVKNILVFPLLEKFFLGWCSPWRHRR